jgi:hypothetical protein
MSSQSHSDRESSAARFSGLINPIRDLALNWDVDIAHTLEDYLDELELLRLPAHLLSERVSDGVAEGGEGGLQGLNFAEAALLIQGSTCVYSKKVEHLHNLVFQALELISASKEGAEKKVRHHSLTHSLTHSVMVELIELARVCACGLVYFLLLGRVA